jgi:hypothetical protein
MWCIDDREISKISQLVWKSAQLCSKYFLVLLLAVQAQYLELLNRHKFLGMLVSRLFGWLFGGLVVGWLLGWLQYRRSADC